MTPSKRGLRSRHVRSAGHDGPDRFTRWVWRFGFLSLLLLSAPGFAQRPFTNLTGVTTRQISNGLRIEFAFDGTFEFIPTGESDWFDFSIMDGPPFIPTWLIRFRIDNARTQAGSFFDVSRYPVSHVEVTIPPGAPEGIGLDVVIHLVQPAMLAGLEVDRMQWDGWDWRRPAFDIRASQDRRRLIVTVHSDRQPQIPESRRSEETAKGLPSELSVVNNAGLLTVRALNAPLVSFAHALSEATGAAITVDDSVTRFIHLSLPVATLSEIVDLLARCYGLVVTPHPTGAGYWITDSSPASGARIGALATEAIPFRYIRASEAADLYPDFLRRFLRPNSSDNSLIVSGSVSLIEKVRRDAVRLDRPTPQIEISLLAVETSSLRDLLARLRVRFDRSDVGVNYDTGSGDLEIRRLDGTAREWDGALKALANRGTTKIVSRSSARVQNHQRATLFVGREEYIIVMMDEGRTQEPRMMTVRAGTRLDVTPWSGGNDEINMELRPATDIVAERQARSGMPVIDRRSIRANLRARSGDTIVIGGLRQVSNLQSRSRIPFLGDLPLIGGLFRSRSKSLSDTEIVFFVTPRIVNPDLPGPMPPAVSSPGVQDDISGGGNPLPPISAPSGNSYPALPQSRR